MLEGFADGRDTMRCGKPDTACSSVKLQFQEKSSSSTGIDEHAQFSIGKQIFYQVIDKFGKVFKRKQNACTVLMPLLQSFLQITQFPI